LANHVIEPGSAGWLERVEIVYRDEIEIIVCGCLFAAQTSRPDTEREKRAGAEPNPLPASESVRHKEKLK